MYSHTYILYTHIKKKLIPKYWRTSQCSALSLINVWFLKIKKITYLLFASVGIRRQLLEVDFLFTVWVPGMELKWSGLGQALLSAEPPCWQLTILYYILFISWRGTMELVLFLYSLVLGIELRLFVRLWQISPPAESSHWPMVLLGVLLLLSVWNRVCSL